MGTGLPSFQSCPNRHVAGGRLWEALRAIGDAARSVTWQNARDAEEAGHLAFRGSPIMADRRCRLTGPAGRARRACRVYPGASGTHAGIAGQILGALTNAA